MLEHANAYTNTWRIQSGSKEREKKGEEEKFPKQVLGASKGRLKTSLLAPTEIHNSQIIHKSKSIFLKISNSFRNRPKPVALFRLPKSMSVGHIYDANKIRKSKVFS